MFDPDIEDIFLQKPAEEKLKGLAGMSVDGLLDMRAQIDGMLPVKDLKDLDLSRELVLQVQALQSLQLRVMSDMNTPANQIAQCANSLSAALVNLVKVQESVYTSERLKRIEAALIECIQTLPTRTQTAFFDRYERVLSA